VAFFNHSTSHMRREARFWALMFVMICAQIKLRGAYAIDASIRLTG